jgi:hypothetical protein
MKISGEVGIFSLVEDFIRPLPPIERAQLVDTIQGRLCAT